MTRRILKWTIPVDGQEHSIGSGPVVHVACQHDASTVEVWTDERHIVDAATARVYATGQTLPERDEVLGSALVLDGALVWHVLRRRP